MNMRLPNITLKTQIRLESKDIDVNEHERLPNITLKTQIRLLSKDIDVNERLPNITTHIRVREQCYYCCSTFQSQ